jgi:hypothetical protein
MSKRKAPEHATVRGYVLREPLESEAKILA